jgi:hypothetical protein
MAETTVSIQNPPSPVPRSPMSPISYQNPYLPYPRIPYPAGQVPPCQNQTPRNP